MSDVDTITVLGVPCVRADAEDHYRAIRGALWISAWQSADGWSVVLSLGFGPSMSSWAGTAASSDEAARAALARLTSTLDALARHGHHIGKLVKAAVGGGS